MIFLVSAMEIRIIKAQDSNEDEIRKMLYHAIHVPEGTEPPSRDILDSAEMARYYRNWGKQGDIGFFAVYNDEVIGAVWLRLFGKDEKGYGYVSPDIPELSIAVSPGYRGRGAGNSLMKTLFNDPSVLNYQAVSLSVSRDNSAVHLYKKYGFIITDEHSSSYIMLRRLN